jgi:hypothetical protein
MKIYVVSKMGVDMAARWLKLKQTGASVASSKVETFEAACSRLKSKLEEQLVYWNNQQDGKETGAKSARSLWFKKKDMGDQWLLKMQIGTTPVYISTDAEKFKNPWGGPIPEDEVAEYIKELIQDIEDGDKALMKVLDNTYKKFDAKRKK